MYALIANVFTVKSRTSGLEFQGRIVSRHRSAVEGARAHRRVKNHGDHDVIEVSWTNGEDARGRQIDWSKIVY